MPARMPPATRPGARRGAREGLDPLPLGPRPPGVLEAAGRALEAFADRSGPYAANPTRMRPKPRTATAGLART